MKLFFALCGLIIAIYLSGPHLYTHRVEVYQRLTARIPWDQIYSVGKFLESAGPWMGIMVAVIILWGEWR